MRKLRHQDPLVEVRLEPRIPAGNSHLIPDVIFWYPNRFPRVAYVADVSVSSEERNPNYMHDEKVQKYSRPEVSSWVRQESSMDLVDVGAIAMTWRGAWSANSANWLTDFPKLKAVG